MPVAASPMVERMARVIAALGLSDNAAGTSAHAASAVDIEWEDHVDDALAILKAMREPDTEMEANGDLTTWQAMIGTAPPTPMPPTAARVIHMPGLAGGPTPPPPRSA